ncbi:hypothetical protein SpiGrapes_0786 [Sphaerochaeta pleomorpha str. Grapes]|uniref:Uncharacterized protein n=1 Tax=Sphaerochaeta pleomorpha (strain ATCC BAA-1885 / DSM 22778 / Grapes) TaxID=158190 RepID=G8QQ43_SPHPG|nr:hypothetical protein [Sphaerochaeta pleomorpha]AEV28620.1 hypothetical protein SpiGrapes_0786 [Sphaerochaeta pleomorpha str. Grapes]
MKKIVLISTVLLLAITTSPLFALTKNTATLTLVAVIPPTATFHAIGNDISVVSNNANFTYSVSGTEYGKTLFVVAK